MLSARSFSWRPHTTFIMIGGLVLVLVALTISYVVANFRPTTEVRIASGVYSLWVADTEAERVQGLSGVEKLSPNGGLLMVYDSDNTWGIWMKDMLVSLDIVWLNSDKEVVYIVKDATPEMSTDTVMIPKDKARYVVELTAGSVDQAGIRTGQVAEFDLSEDATSAEAKK